MRKCLKCGEEKELQKFRKRQVWYSHTCKLCYAKEYRTGKPNLTRFKKGHIPWIKGRKGVKKREIPKYEKKPPRVFSEHPLGLKRNQWAVSVKKRDGYKCRNCGTEKDLHAHHIIKWKDDMGKRFDLNNGITLCRSCHCREERLLETRMGLPGCSLRNKKVR